jgi:hypothetical protein
MRHSAYDQSRPPAREKPVNEPVRRTDGATDGLIVRQSRWQALRSGIARSPLRVVAAVWLAGLVFIAATAPGRPVLVTHWANGHMMDQQSLFPTFAREFNAADNATEAGRQISVELFRANSGEIVGELKARIQHGQPIDREKPDPGVVTPAADHWVNDVNHALGREALDVANPDSPATTYIGIVTSREMAQCLGWPEREIGFADVVELATDPRGWTKYDCAKPEWGREALLAFTYPNRSSTARSVLYSLYGIAAQKPTEQLTLEDVTRTPVAEYVRRFQTAIDCYVPDTLDLNVKILSSPACAHFFFVAEDNLVKLYQGKILVPNGDQRTPRSLERDMVMIYPKEGAIRHNHSAFVVSADFVSAEQSEAARAWIAFLHEPAQQQALMQAGFRRTSGSPCIDPLGSPFSPCASTPGAVIYPDRIDAAVAAAILRAWE